MRYVAFVRGINVGGNSIVRMEDLRNIFEKLGFKNIKTLLNSGNVVFEAELLERSKLIKNIELELRKKYDREINVVVRTMENIQNLVESDPFRKITITSETRLYITFLSSPAKATQKISYESPEKDFKILSVSSSEVCSVLTLSPKRQTTKVMSFLEKEFGKKITTRNWNTVCKIAHLTDK